MQPDLTPAVAKVCGKILGHGFDRLIGAPLWYHVGDRLLSPLSLALIALAILTATRVPRLRGIALVAGLMTAIQAVNAIGATVFPNWMLIAAEREGCGEAYRATALVSSFLALLLTAAFVVAPDRPRGART